MRLLFASIDIILELCSWFLATFAALYLLHEFGAIDVRSGRLAVIHRYLDRVTAPALWPIRKLMPDLGGLDLSPVILIIILMTVRYTIALYAVPKFI